MCKTYLLKTFKVKFNSKMDEKMTRDILVDPLPPGTFGDTVVNPPPQSVMNYLNDPLYYDWQ